MASFFKQTFELLNSMAAPRATPQPAPPPRRAASSGATTTTTNNQGQAQRRHNNQRCSQASQQGHPPTFSNQSNRATRQNATTSSPNQPNQSHGNNFQYNYRQPYHQCNQQQRARQQRQNFSQHNNNDSQETGAKMTTSTDRSESEQDISEMNDLSDIDSLATKNLKRILDKNCVDYKNVIEKEDLRAKVRILWLDYHSRRERNSAKNREGGQSDSFDSDIDDKRMCKICMEKEINCVLLECGHMICCVECGKKMKDCPVCRESVARCVRTYQV